MLTVTRTANAGVMLELDGMKILLDGVCREVSPYLATPDSVKERLYQCFPDLVAVTHRHEDHCDPAFEQRYESAVHRPVIGPEFSGQQVICGNVTLTAVPSRHIGKSDCSHVSFVIEGTHCVWFMGDASPNQWKNRADLKKPDVLICPYAYAATESAWRMTCSLGAKATVLLHLPEPDKDTYGLWAAVKQTVGEKGNVFIPEMGEFVKITF